MRTPLVVSLFVATACAPLVSNRDWRQDSVRAKPAVSTPRVAHAKPAPKTTPAPKPVAPKPVAQKPVLVARASQPEPVAPAPKSAPAPEPEFVPAAVPPTPAAPVARSFYSFTDQEIRGMQKRSKKFRKLLKQHQRCTKKTERLIAERGKIRDEIIVLQNLEAPSRRQIKKLESLRDKEWRMKNDRGALAACEPLESQLTQMLRETYETTASIGY